ncbi:MAG: hypothetical protein AB7S26_22270 [Sandaracinaceae bacterium]
MSARTGRMGWSLAACLALVACDGHKTPFAIEGQIVPSRTWYHTGEMVVLRGFVTAADGEPIEDVEVAWTVDDPSVASGPTLNADPREATFTLLAEGTAVFTGCVVPDDADAVPTLCDTVRIRIDDGMPSLEVSSPMPGDQLTGDPSITVTGSVADRDMVHVYINGVPADVDAMGMFAGAIDARFGVNHIVVSATDGLTDVSEVEMDVLWANGYLPAVGLGGNPEVDLDDGLRLWLGQDFFDDGAPIDPAARPIVTRDLADVLELVLANLDLQSLIPNPIANSPPSFTLTASNATIGAATVEIDCTDDGVDLFIRLGDISADTSGALMVDTVSLPLTGTVHASAVGFAHLEIRKVTPLAPLRVTLSGLTVGLEDVQGDFVSDETDAVFLLATGILRMTLEDALVQALNDSVGDTVPMVVSDALNSVDSALAGREIAIDSAPFPAVNLGIDGRVGVLEWAFRRDMLATIRFRLSTDVPAVHPESPGVPLYDERPALPFVNEGRIQLGFRIAFLNGLLHTLWNSGFLEVDATPLLPDAVSGLVSEARIVGRMPPVVRPAREDETDDLVLTLGQLELELVYMGETVRYGLALDAGLNIDVRDNLLSVTIAETPNLRIWTLVPPSNPRLLTEDTMRELLLGLWPMLSSSLAGGLNIDLPIPALGDLGGLSPDLAGLQLELSALGRVRPRRDVLELEAALVGTLP